METKIKSQAINIDSIYPVGSIYISTVSTNPSNYFGGTWVAFGAGKTLVGLDSGDTDFDTSEETGGAKTHTLTVNEMPIHTHTQNVHSHTIMGQYGRLASSDSTGSGEWGQKYTRVASGATAINYSEALLANSTTATNQNAGGNQAHNNLQPYIVTYFFKRTA